MLTNISGLLEKPELYAPGSGNFWDDEHISKKMLDAHLNTTRDAASRNHKFIDKSVEWISKIAPPAQYKQLLDLGCGPGLYAERFNAIGYHVTGVDFSKRSIEYAKGQALHNNSNIQYLCQNYLRTDFTQQFDVITQIYCDYASFSRNDRLLLLNLVYRALKPNGKFIFDVFTPKVRKAEKKSWSYLPNGGFWSAQPHLCLESIYQYDDEDNTELRQSIVCTDETIQCFNVWDHFFTKESLLSEIRLVDFSRNEFYGDVAGAEFSADSETICCVLTKPI